MKLGRAFWVVCLVVVVPLALAQPALAKKKPKASTTTTTTVPKPPPGPIFQLQGNGTTTTDVFKVPSNWDLAYSYDCTNFFGGKGNFIVSIYDYYGQKSQLDLDNQGINKLGTKESGVDHYHSGGNKKYLEINSECDWTVTVGKGKA